MNRVCILIPTYNHQRTLAEVVRRAVAFEPVIVVDDGSTDATPKILGELAEELDGLTLFTHPRNIGKGAALATGLEHAHRLGFSHVITLDSDGQHLAEDIPLFRAALERGPDTLWLGSRDFRNSGAGLTTRFGHWFSNLCARFETGRQLADTQTGFRCYPLAPLRDLFLGSISYDFETEIMVRAAWIGVELDTVPIGVRYFRGVDRVSHMRPVLDFVRITWLNTKLCAQRMCFRRPYLGIRARRAFREQSMWQRFKMSFRELFLRDPGSPRRIAGSVAIGLFMGIAPVWGFQILITILLAHLLNASKLIAVLAANISLPFMVQPIVYGALLLGRLAVGDTRAVPDCWTLELQPSDHWPWVLGSVLLATVVAVVGSAMTYLCATAIQRSINVPSCNAGGIS